MIGIGNRFRLITFALCGFLVQCSSESGSKLNSGLDPKPESETLGMLEMSKRFEGQSEFLTIEERYYRDDYGLPGRNAASEESTRGGGKRDIQESDIYKIGPKGSKLLYLLNSYKGLQTVGYDQSLTMATLKSNYKGVTGTPYEMYHLEEQAKLLTLEQTQINKDGSYANYRDQESVLRRFDLKNPEMPIADGELKFQGNIADSRLVGNILYVATISYDYSNRYQNNNQTKGFLYSFEVGTEKFSLKQKHEFGLAVNYRESLNIVETKEDDAYKYYAIASLSERGWNSWNGQTQIEVADISSDEGIIKPLMTVVAKGMVRERSQTSIKDGTLLVTSNYFTDNAAGSLRRIAVETFLLPEENPKLISEDEAELRRLYIKREVGKVAIPEQDAVYEKLMADPEWGLKGLFVKRAEKTLLKVASDSKITLGDTTGLNASLRDVRYDDDLLYIFWVPQNEIDPFDLIDISKPREGIKYIKRLSFDGWIDRAIPVKYQDRQFIIGLGWIVDNVNNERGIRRPQAKLFELMDRYGQTQILEVETFNFASNIWTNFNNQDKYVEVNFENEDSGSILFPVYVRGDSYKQGGKLIHFDIATLLEGGKAFEDGSLIEAEGNWLRRVFTNPEINALNAFTNEFLSTYAAGEDLTYKSIHTLELARNTLDYIPMESHGLQIVRRGKGWYGSDSKTEFALIKQGDIAAKDGLDPKVLQKVSLPGNYIANYRLNDEAVIVLTQVSENNYNEETERYEYSSKYHLGLVRLADSPNGIKLLLADTKIVEDKSQKRIYSSSLGNLLEDPMGNDSAILLVGGKMFVVSLEAQKLNLQEMLMEENCNQQENTYANLIMLGSDLYMESVESIESEEYPGVYFRKNLISKIDMDREASKAVCGKALNIPGKALSINNGYLLTRDSRLLDLKKYDYETRDAEGNVVKEERYEAQTEDLYTSVKLAENAKAMLTDLIERDQHYNADRSMKDGRIVFVEQTTESSRYYPYRGIDRGWMPHYPVSQAESNLVILSVNDAGRFLKQSFYTDININGNVYLSEIVNIKGKDIVLLMRDRAIYARALVKNDLLPVAILDGEEKMDYKVLQGSYWRAKSVGLDAQYATLYIPLSFYGIEKIVLDFPEI